MCVWGGRGERRRFCKIFKVIFFKNIESLILVAGKSRSNLQVDNFLRFQAFEKSERIMNET